jgi:hypothetical protein
MARLFERFVAEWLRVHLPEGLELQDQEDVPIGEGWGISFTIDMVLYDRKTGRPMAVLDTKYKPVDRPQDEFWERVKSIDYVFFAEVLARQTSILAPRVLLKFRFIQWAFICTGLALVSLLSLGVSHLLEFP